MDLSLLNFHLMRQLSIWQKPFICRIETNSSASANEPVTAPRTASGSASPSRREALPVVRAYAGRATGGWSVGFATGIAPVGARRAPRITAFATVRRRA